jgi:tetratricopeptide (TPR) repeat protein
MTDTPPNMHFGPARPATEVKTAGACQELIETQQATVKPRQFIEKIGVILVDHRQAAAAEWVRRYPDVAWEVLRSATTEDAANPVVLFIARVHDQQCGRQQMPGSWLAMLDDRVAHPQAYVAFDAARARLQQSVLAPKTLANRDLAEGLQAPNALLEIEACRLVGDAYLQCDRPADAVPVLIKGLALAEKTSPYLAAQLALALGDAHRRAGHLDEGAANWQKTLTLAVGLLDAATPVADPVLWTRLAALRPSNVDWPRPGAAASPRDNAAAEVDLWKNVGQWRLDRAEHQIALSAFKRAETLAGTDPQRDELQLAEARALMQMRQPAAAVTLLARLAEQNEPNTVAPALAMLGSIKLAQGDKLHGLALLQRAIEAHPGLEWHGRAEAEADLGLALLMNGDEPGGLRCLHQAQVSFEKEGSTDMLIQCLNNEANYLRHTNKRDQAADIGAKITRLQSTVNP